MPQTSRLVLVGGQDKRSTYFLRAAQQEQTQAFTFSYEEYLEQSRPGDRVKLDPLPFAATDFAALAPFVERYRRLLTACAALPGVFFLNDPLEILAALDKQETRRRLSLNGVPIAPALHGDITDFDSLVHAMHEQSIWRVFMKPRFGSGASGIIAFASTSNPAQGKYVMYTSLQECDSSFQNTKKIHRIHKYSEQRRLLDVVLAGDCVIERWVPKANIRGINYDLRVLWQCGKRAFIVPRGSRGPITNLHLNDMALDLEDIGLSELQLQRIDRLCSAAMNCFPKLTCAGLDILLPPRNAAPLVLEINAQGDLIYKDIFAENTIYRQQVRYMCSDILSMR